MNFVWLKQGTLIRVVHGFDSWIGFGHIIYIQSIRISCKHPWNILIVRAHNKLRPHIYYSQNYSKLSTNSFASMANIVETKWFTMLLMRISWPWWWLDHVYSLLFIFIYFFYVSCVSYRGGTHNFESILVVISLLRMFLLLFRVTLRVIQREVIRKGVILVSTWEFYVNLVVGLYKGNPWLVLSFYDE